MFSEEFAAQAQAQLGEAMQLLKEEDPQLWQQLEGLAAAAATSDVGGEGVRSGGGEGVSGGGEGVRSGGGEGVGGEGVSGGGEGGEGSLESKLEKTLRRLKESTEQIEVGVACIPLQLVINIAVAVRRERYLICVHQMSFHRTLVYCYNILCLF